MRAKWWALWAVGGSLDLFRSYWGYLPVVDALCGLTLLCGPSLWALRRRLRGAFSLRSRLPTAPWGIYEGGKQMRPAATLAQAGRAALLRGQDARRPSNFVDSSAPPEGR
jgi:hypothetical protein